MQRVRLPNTNLSVSRFSYGTAQLHHVGSAKSQIAHLEAAAEQGFSHFDTAPLYGFGGAERALGQAFSRESEITVATKVGLYPPGGCEQGRAETLARKAAGKVWPKLSRPVVDLAVERARESLERSLQRLGRDKIDLLLLHEPSTEFLQTDEWLDWIEKERDRIRNVGIAGPQAVVKPFLDINNPLTLVIQTRDNLERREADILTSAGRPFQLTYGYFTGHTHELDGREVLSTALARNTTGSIIVSTRSRERLKAFAEVERLQSELH
ncbi:aldo/keto reductase [bacterium]|nr:aldo/keto reductase [bacterium]